MKEFLNNSYLFGGNAPFIEELYEKYLANPPSVPRGVARLLRPHAGPARRQRQGRRACARGRVFRADARRRVSSPQRARCRRSRSRPSGCRSRRCCWSLRVPHRRLALGHARSAEAHAAAAHPGARAGLLRPEGSRPRPGGERGLVRRAGSASHCARLVQALRETYCRNIGFEYMFISRPGAAAVDPGAHRADRAPRRRSRPKSRSACCASSPRPSTSSATCTRATSARSASRSRAAKA